ncbi:Flp family type IVb pilin [Vibrio sp.]|nr:Flp family type IVb pilin [Vibrio sp.]
MNNFVEKCKAFWKDEEGLTVVEYVIGAGLLVVALTAVFTTMNTKLSTKLSTIISNIDDGT